MGMAANARPELPRTCSRSDGRPKLTFATKNEAIDALDEGRKQWITAYRCRTCGMWHHCKR